MFPLTLTLHTPAQLHAVLAALSLEEVEAAPRPTPPPVETRPETPAPEKAAKAPPKAKPEPVKASEPEPIAYETLRQLTLKAIKTKGRDAVAGLLASHGVKAAPDLVPEQYAAFMAGVQALLED